MVKRLLFPAAVFVLLMALSACGARKPVTITMWHNYGGQMQSAMDSLVDEFNSTVGKEKGVIVNVTAIAAFKDVEANLRLIADGEPGAPAMPDITVAYPKTAMFLAEQDLLAPLDNQFTQKELDAYLPAFINEGRLPDRKLYVFPIAKSTEVLFLNRTLFDRFAADTGVTAESLSTLEGIAAAASRYVEWSGGAAFYTADSWFNLAIVGMAQKGLAFVSPDSLDTSADAYRALWNVMLPAAACGGFAVSESYSSDLSKTGEIICSTGSTAGILFYGDSVTYPDNTIEAVAYEVLPYPVLSGGEKVALQRGAGMAIAKSTDAKERAAAAFLKWFTAPAQNMRFVTGTGYLPVTNEAFEKNMSEEIDNVENESIRKLLTAAALMYREYEFIVAPNYEQFDAISKEYEAACKQALRDAHEQLAEGGDAQAVSGALYEGFMR